MNEWWQKSLMGREVHRMLIGDEPIAHGILLRKESFENDNWYVLFILGFNSFGLFSSWNFPCPHTTRYGLPFLLVHTKCTVCTTQL
jgi:hypothetical protein